jgi:hypothetical protein
MRSHARHSFTAIGLFLAGFSLATQLLADAPIAGQVIGRNIFGLATDVNADPLLRQGLAYIHKGAAQNETIVTEGIAYRVTVFNDQVGDVYLTRLDDEGQVSVDTFALDLSPSAGLSNPGILTKTDWNTLLLAENILVDARDHKAFAEQFAAYYKDNAELINPYNYGWSAELIMLDARGDAKVIKNFAPGRLAAEQALVMPDSRTVYFLDADADRARLYLFVADEAGSLANGALYAAHRKSGGVAYLPLGEGNALRLKLKLKRMKFSDLFDAVEAQNKACAKGYTLTESAYGVECLKLKKKNQRYPAA